jgi:hypothetical protein
MDRDYSGNHTKLPKILLNGNNICMVGPSQRDAKLWILLTSIFSSFREARGLKRRDERLMSISRGNVMTDTSTHASSEKEH